MLGIEKGVISVLVLELEKLIPDNVKFLHDG